MGSTRKVAEEGQRRTKVGVGASGDTTILADKAAEDEILRSLKGVDGVRVLSEEAGELGPSQAPFVAVVDPLDGSSNYGRGIPFYCSSIAVAEGDDLSKVFFGHVRNLVNGDVFQAELGKGATKNGRPVRASAVEAAADAVIGVDLSRTTERVVQALAPLLSSSKRQVHFGANALELCLVADGTIDATVDLRGKMRVTDFAAGQLIAREAGAVVTDAKGAQVLNRLDLAQRFSYVAAANARLHGQILALTKNIG